MPLAAFGWGYSVGVDGDPRLSPVERLTGADWDAHTAYLTERYPAWTFGDGSPLG